MSSQSIVDRLNAAKHTVAGSALGRAVVKATTEEIMGPKRKHLEYLLACTSELNVSIPQMADLLIERTQNTSWVVTYKSLITIHHLMCFGNERFSQYMASHNSKFTLNNFMDKTGVQGIDMSSYIRKYAHYLNEKRETYKLMGFDFCKVKRGKDDGVFRTMSGEKLLKAIPILVKQLDALVLFDVQANELTNGVINSCFLLLSKDLIRLFACYNDGIINLLEKFFDMNKKMCKEALDIYKKFLERSDSVTAFLKVAESSGIDKSDIPDLTKAPSSLLEALEAHVNGPDAKKNTTAASTNNTNNASSNKPAAVTNAISSLNSNNALLSAEEKRRVLEEEAKTLESFKSTNNFDHSNEKNHLKKQTSLTSPTNENPFGAQNAAPSTNGNHQQKASSNQDDLFGLDLTNTNSFNPAQSTSNTSSASDDLLMLSGANPFIQNIVNQSYAAQPVNPMLNPFQANNMMAPGVMAPSQMNLFQQPNHAAFPMNPMAVNNNANKMDDLFGGLNFTAGKATTNLPTNSAAPSTEFDAFGDVLQPTNKAAANSTVPTKQPGLNGTEKTEQKILSNDLESSLASLADNLDINHKNKNFQKNHQWNTNVQQSQLKTGGQNWTKPSMPANNAPLLGSPVTNTWNAPSNGVNANWNANPFAAAMQPMMNPTMPQQPTIKSSNPFDLF